MSVTADALRRVRELADAWVGIEHSHAFGDAVLTAIGAEALNAVEPFVQRRSDLDADGLGPAGRHLREVAATGSEAVRPWSYVPCAREHEPGRLCIRPDGHD